MSHISDCIVLFYLELASLVLNVYNNCFNSCTAFCNWLSYLFITATRSACCDA